MQNRWLRAEVSHLFSCSCNPVHPLAGVQGRNALRKAKANDAAAEVEEANAEGEEGMEE